MESKIKAKVKECEKLRTELEVARNETQVESDSQLTVQAQLKTELKELLTENSEMKRKMKTKEEKVKTLEEKVACADKEKVSLLSKLEAAKRNFKKELDDQEVMYKEKIKGLEKMFETLQAKIDKLNNDKNSEHEKEARKEVMTLETRNEQLEKEKMIILREKNELTADWEKTKKDLGRISKEKETYAEELKTLKEKREDTVIVDIEETSKLKKEIEKLQEKQTTEAGKKLKRTSEQLVEKRDSLKEQEAKLKMMKGRPVALKKFLEEVVLPGCALCPP